MKRILTTLSGRAGILKELFAFLWENRLWWMIPFVLVLALVGVLIVFAQTSPVAPFMYALF